MALAVVIEGRSGVVDKKGDCAVGPDRVIRTGVLDTATMSAVIGRRERQRVIRHRRVRHIKLVDLTWVKINKSLLDPVNEILTTRRGDRQDDRRIHSATGIGIIRVVIVKRRGVVSRVDQNLSVAYIALHHRTVSDRCTAVMGPIGGRRNLKVLLVPAQRCDV